MNPDWQQAFFNQRTVIDMWRQACSPEQTRLEADFLERHLGAKKRLLDVPCGTGRHALELARRGSTVTGVDISDGFLEFAKTQVGSLPATFQLADMRKIALDAAFDGAYCMGNSFAYFDTDDTHLFLAAVAKALKPKGLFVLDAGTAAETLLPELKDRTWYGFGDYLFLIDNRYLAETSTLETEATFIRDGKIEKHKFWHVVRTVAEIRRLLEDAGFEVRRFFSSLDGQPYKLRSPGLYLVAEKTA
jgi:SAM-dependent methyltransferase